MALLSGLIWSEKQTSDTYVGVVTAGCSPKDYFLALRIEDGRDNSQVWQMRTSEGCPAGSVSFDFDSRPVGPAGKRHETAVTHRESWKE